MSITYTEVLDCWFGTPDSPAYSHWRAAWFKRDEAFDAMIRQRLFVYLPYEHAEDLAHQHTAVRLITQLVADEPTFTEPLFWTRHHCETITRFGRFPHRNALLGRVSTAAEHAFLDGGWSA